MEYKLIFIDGFYELTLVDKSGISYGQATLSGKIFYNEYNEIQLEFTQGNNSLIVGNDVEGEDSFLLVEDTDIQYNSRGFLLFLEYLDLK
jgi:hypothetical protein